MTSTLALHAAPAARLDFGLVSRAFLSIGLALALASPLSPNPFAFAAGAMMPWLLIQIVSTPTMPAGILFWLLWQWLQIFARVVVTVIDSQPMSRSVFGNAVEDAYWYMMISLVVLALAVRLVLGNLRAPSERDLNWHLNWRPIDAFFVYLASFGLNLAAGYAVSVFPSLYQQIDAVGKFKLASEFVLFAIVLGSGRGYQLLCVAAAMELVVGITGLLSDFRSVFVVLAVAAIAARVRVSGVAAVAGAGWLAVLVGLSLFWTATKMDYRDYITAGSFDEEGDETQTITVGFEDRFAFIGSHALAPGEIEWGHSSYILLLRLAYVDIFGSVVGVNQFFGAQGVMRQWSDALAHVFQPRFLFPDKPALSDTEVYLRLTHADPTETLRASTSISVGYMGENYADLRFPGMLIGIFVIGAIVAGVARYFMSTPLPWMVRQSIVIAFIYAAAGTGVEVSLPKILGGVIMFLIVYGLLIRFAFPTGIRWLDNRARAARELQDNVRRAAAASMARAARP